MSQENLEVVRRVYEHVLSADHRADPATLRTWIQELFDPDVEVKQMEDMPGTAGTFHGYQGCSTRHSKCW